MKHARGRLLFAAAALVVVAAGCGVSSQDHPASGHATPTLTLSVPGDPSARVTDIRAYALTPKQVRDFNAKCRQAQGVPVDAQGCANTVLEFAQGLVASPGPTAAGAPRPCTPEAPACLVIGITADRENAVAKIVNSQPGKATCTAGEGAPCGGIKLPGSSVAQVFNQGPSAIASSPVSPSPTPSGGPEPSYSNPAPTATSGVPPANPAETGAGSSP